VIGYWLLVIGYWLLVIGYWLLVIESGSSRPVRYGTGDTSRLRSKQRFSSSLCYDETLERLIILVIDWSFVWNYNPRWSSDTDRNDNGASVLYREHRGSFFLFLVPCLWFFVHFGFTYFDKLSTSQCNAWFLVIDLNFVFLSMNVTQLMNLHF